MTFDEFFRFLKKWRSAKRYPPVPAWPQSISLSPQLWQNINHLFQLTNSDGHEYETSYFYLEGETIPTKPLRGTESEVLANHSFNVRFVPRHNEGVYEKQIFIDNALLRKETVKPDSMSRNVESGYLFNIHTHPAHPFRNDIPSYGFFSTTDIQSLLKSPSYMIGLITQEFWLACKTDRAISTIGSVGEEMLSRVNEHYFEGSAFVESTIKEQMQNWGLVFYRAKFNGPLLKVN